MCLPFRGLLGLRFGLNVVSGVCFGFVACLCMFEWFPVGLLRFGFGMLWFCFAVGFGVILVLVLGMCRCCLTLWSGI